MGPRRTPHKQREPGNYEALGKIGRRTGTTLEDTGVRDENGFEPIPSFSSPAKSLFQPNRVTHDATNSAEDSMEIDHSTIPEPAELMRSTRNGRISLPPKATSPIKTHLNSSPRRSTARSVGPLSSPSRNSNNGTPTRNASHLPMSKPPNRLLDFSPERTIQSVEKSPRSFPLAQSNNAKSAPSNKGKGKGRKAFDLTGGGGDYDDMETDAYDGSNLNNGTMNDDESIAPLLDDQPMGNSIDDQETLDADRTGEQPQAFEADDSGLMGPPATSGAQEPIKKRGRERKSKTLAQDELETSMPAPDQPRRGRPPKKTQVYQDPDANLRGTPSPRPKSKRLPPPSLRDPNARSKVKKTANAKPPSRAGSVAAGPRFIQRSETPANDSGALITRFGRQSIKPLASWRGEKTVMGDRTFDSLPGIKEVIRVDEVVEPRPRQRYRKGPHRAKARLADVEEEIEDEKAPWELDPGIVTAQVMEWDSNTNRYDEENIAFAFDAIEMRDIKGAEFKFAKTLTLDFFGAGMVELHPGGAKRIKNSRKMQMVFFVFYGRVTVSIGTPPTKFSIGKGGQWHVPRGNFYSITNESDENDARMFFAQGCEVQAGALDESTMA